jgi:hypothetical protein
VVKEYSKGCEVKNFRVKVTLRVKGLRLRVQGSELKVQVLGLRAQGLYFRVIGLGLKGF